MFRLFRKPAASPGAGAPVAAGRAPSAASGAVDPSVETIDDWFVRTTRLILKQARRGAGPDGKRKSDYEQRVVALEQANAALKADNERLSSEVVALRTLLYPQRRGR